MDSLLVIGRAGWHWARLHPGPAMGLAALVMVVVAALARNPVMVLGAAAAAWLAGWKTAADVEQARYRAVVVVEKPGGSR